MQTILKLHERSKKKKKKKVDCSFKKFSAKWP